MPAFPRVVAEERVNQFLQEAFPANPVHPVVVAHLVVAPWTLHAIHLLCAEISNG